MDKQSTKVKPSKIRALTLPGSETYQKLMVINSLCYSRKHRKVITEESRDKVLYRHSAHGDGDIVWQWRTDWLLNLGPWVLVM
jgi:hypothetical protein